MFTFEELLVLSHRRVKWVFTLSVRDVEHTVGHSGQEGWYYSLVALFKSVGGGIERVDFFVFDKNLGVDFELVVQEVGVAVVYTPYKSPKMRTLVQKLIILIKQPIYIDPIIFSDLWLSHHGISHKVKQRSQQNRPWNFCIPNSRSRVDFPQKIVRKRV